jgi:pimeloyl-ACP methyl ester carboxylesterase
MFFEKHDPPSGSGSRPPVVLIHGLGAYSFSWRETLTALSGRFTTYAVDLLGFGKSDALAGFAYTMAAQAEAVAAFMAQEDLSDPIVVGHSMGGGICLRLAERAGKGDQPKLSGMVLVAPVAFPLSMPFAGLGLGELTAMGGAAGVVPSLVSEGLATRLLEAAYAPSNKPNAQQIAGYAAGLSKVGQIKALHEHAHDISDVTSSNVSFDKIKIKTLIIWGDQDPFMDASYRARLEQKLPHASVQQIANCGHVPQEERPIETNNHIEAFLNSL